MSSHPDPLLVPLAAMCEALCIPERTYYRLRRAGLDVPHPVSSPTRKRLFAWQDVAACAARWHKRAVPQPHVSQRRSARAAVQVNPCDQGALISGGVR
jgi:hypothetical protein